MDARIAVGLLWCAVAMLFVISTFLKWRLEGGPRSPMSIFSLVVLTPIAWVGGLVVIHNVI